MPERPSCLLVPAAGAGEGMGHLLRCLVLARELGGRTSILTARMDQHARALLAERLRTMPARTRPALINRMKVAARWDIIVVDARKTTRAELDLLMAHGLVICLDEGGEAAAFAPFLVDSIPSLPGVRKPNRASSAFLSLPRRSRSAIRFPPRRVLLSFGGEDRQRLSEAMLHALVRKRIFEPRQLTVVEGPLFGARQWPREASVMRQPAELSRALPEFDLLITHFGITAFEALASGVPVLLFNPSRYHARLGAASGFHDVGMRVPDLRVLQRLMANPAPLSVQVDAFNREIGTRRTRGLARLLASIGAQGSSSCPICGQAGDPVLDRFPTRTYRRCSSCGTVFLESFTGSRKRYDVTYFSSAYRAQYGRTYLEDFESIKSASRERVRIMREQIAEGLDGMVIDVGCAYGPFLDALKDAGIPGYGLDVPADAVAYVRKKLRTPALRSSFETAARSALPRRIAAVTMWYVLEHFEKTDEVLRKISGLLPRGGVFAFSTPNGRGTSARSDMGSFLQASPADHFTILSPKKLGKLLSRYDLELRRVRVTGHHPDRFPGLLGKAAKRFAAAHATLLFASRLLGLGDTFEAYAVKGEP